MQSYSRTSGDQADAELHVSIFTWSSFRFRLSTWYRGSMNCLGLWMDL